MTKVFSLTDIDCPVCAGKVQDLVSKIDGVKSARVDFLVLKLTIEADEADVYIVNTCAVTNMAERKSRQVLSKIEKLNINYIKTPLQ